MPPSADLQNLRTTAVASFGVILLITSYRCFARLRRRIWWHDDSVAVFAAFTFIFYVIGVILLQDVDQFIFDDWSCSTQQRLLSASASMNARIRASSLMIFGLFTPLWGGRISIALTGVRITPWSAERLLMRLVVTIFVAEYILMIAEAYWVCEIACTGWKQNRGSICVLPRVLSLAHIVTAVLSDSILIIATPWTAVRYAEVRGLYRRLFWIFFPSIMTMAASLAHALVPLVYPDEGIFGCLDGAMSVIVSSMSLMIPAILRRLRVGDPFQLDSGAVRAFVERSAPIGFVSSNDSITLADRTEEDQSSAPDRVSVAQS